MAHSEQNGDDADISRKAVAEFVAKCGGTRVITSVLIANNGIAAVKCIRSIRRFNYEMFGDERAIKFVAMATPEDIKVNAEYIKMADRYIKVPGGTNNNNYANVELIVDIAQRTNVQAVWAGWGHASENPKLPTMLRRIDIAFIGPPASAMDALGDKIASSIVAQSADVPTLPWNGTGVTIDVNNLNGANLEVPADVYEKGIVSTMEEGAEAAERIGYPVMIKASEGGGGKGIRKVEKPEQFAAFFRQAQNEVPGSPIFIMQLAKRSRHLEVQLLADQYGQAISLFGRDCSVQRRHQKIIEEAPAAIADPLTFEEMEKAAIRLAKLVGYQSAGTVEYLYEEPEEGTEGEEKEQFYFLELNPRLQVEHPCTEMVSDVNLPAAQLQVAMGIPLHRMKDIRMLYGESAFGDNEIDFDDFSKRRKANGHVIAARITAENPDEGFKPTGGNITNLNFRSSTNVWGYFSIDGSGALHEYADSQFGHIFAWGEDRDHARRNMAVALREVSIRGEIRTTVEYIVMLLETDAFLRNKISTGWLDKLIAEKLQSEKPEVMTSVISAAVHICANTFETNYDLYLKSVERGQFLDQDMLKTSMNLDLIHDGVKYTISVSQNGSINFVVIINGLHVDTTREPLNDGGSLVEFNTTSYVVYMKEEVDGYRVIVNSKTIMFEKENDPTVLRSTSPGKLIRYLVEDFTHVDANTAVAEIEVMKMVMPVTVDHAGTIRTLLQPGSVLSSGDIMAKLTLDDADAIRPAEPFTGQLPPYLQGLTREDEKVHQIASRCIAEVSTILDGYCVEEPLFSQRCAPLVRELKTALSDANLPLLELQEIMAAIASRIPAHVSADINAQLTTYAYSVNSMFCSFPTQAIATVLDTYAASLKNKGERDDFFAAATPIFQLIQKYRNGVRGHQKTILTTLLAKYYDVESIFSTPGGQGLGDILYALSERRKKDGEDTNGLVDIVRSHSRTTQKNKVVLLLLSALIGDKSGHMGEDEKRIVEKLATLTHKTSSPVAVRARQLLIQSTLPSFKRRCLDMEIFIQSAIEDQGQGAGNSLQLLVDESVAVFDTITHFFRHHNREIQYAALEVYVRRSYRAYQIQNIKHDMVNEKYRVVEWKFLLPQSHPNIRHLFAGYGKHMIDAKTANLTIGANTTNEGLMIPTPTSHDKTESSGLAHRRSDSLNSLKSLSLHTRTSSSNLSAMGKEDSIKRVASISDKVDQLDKLYQDNDWARHGAMALFADLTEFRKHAEELIRRFPTKAPASTRPAMNILNIALTHLPGRSGDIDTDSVFEVTDDQISQVIAEQMAGLKDVLRERQVRRVSFLILQNSSFPKYFTFRDRFDYEEDSIYRHLEPALAFQLELFKLENYNITYVPTNNLGVHLYYSEAKDNSAKGVSQNAVDRRFFMRSIIRHADLLSKRASLEYFFNEGERVVVEALNELEVFNNSADYPRTDCNMIFLNFVPTVAIDLQSLLESLVSLVERHGLRFWKNRVLQAEIKLAALLNESDDSVSHLRVMIDNDTGFALNIVVYEEVYNKELEQVSFQTIFPLDYEGPMHGQDASLPYSTKSRLQLKRFQAQSNNTTFVKDFPELFRQGLRELWSEPQAATLNAEHKHSQLVEVTDYVLNKEDILVPSQSKELFDEYADVGMSARRLKMYTPEYPEGREAILICNDITHVIGSFGVREDKVFQQASQMAREEGIPRIYVSVNSGARIGLAKEVMAKFKICWKDPNAPNKGFEYLYLTEADHAEMSEKSVVSERIIVDGEVRYEIKAVVGKDDGLGVENLHGSGMIAGETAQAYEDTFTITLVSCRSVGIGAYLVRLGQRTVQVEGSSIILTGAEAINKLLGSKVYTSNQQLGGTQIMYHNGVSHLTSKDDYDGVYKILQWLAYVPKTRNSPLPCRMLRDVADPVDRPIDFMPSKIDAYDPRHMLAGFTDTDGSFKTGFFDRDSFMETLGGWAKTVVTGRARLGGIPVGVIAVETRTVELATPADPANIDTQSSIQNQAGQVWFPDSAFKTAQSISDIDKEGLPLIIFANWRGFSGGMRDMLDEVLKFGAQIVSALKDFQQPVLIYIPPYGELRGGAWVVVDPAINPDMMEMYCDQDARGGVLEPEGTVSVKFRWGDQLKVMLQNDAVYADLIKQRKEALEQVAIASLTTRHSDSLANTPPPSPARTFSVGDDSEVDEAKRASSVVEKLDQLIAKREKEMKSVYHQVAVQFADLHDRADRMKQKGCVSDILKWRQSRETLYWHMRRRILEVNACKTIMAASDSIVMGQALSMLRRWIVVETSVQWDDDRTVVASLEANDDLIQENVKGIRRSKQMKDMENIIDANNDSAVNCLMHLIERMAPGEKDEMYELMNSSRQNMNA
ncbi:hypothetical protein SARC_03882 [Sphaeroforma arctica JP610]|uniref:Uncharacterized protein n=1 Tax=Sphaeroforma arctica JP610 TaxID=667725 RepID=A0A0L0G4R0_9EUKA|nr:hypothetical protein SARC_03882 [Sphaeroforma arctica JP610]KNC83894.1 hypothetical protein SARC_03882 [Sphaeroforma arctica JP610]|eukprot:XP_014157796.1 hypothetical protein SARC_03882 [Sphaeroforma arctica JP610]